jgi:SAM-dependent methyltransferase
MAGTKENQWPQAVRRRTVGLVPQNNFDERVARRYATYWPHLFETGMIEPPVEFLAELAADGAALELGIGTGRLALPLSRRGVPVHGIELSAAMVAELRKQPGGDRIGVTIGDFAAVTTRATFRLAYLVRNTITNLITQAEQVACFRNVAAQLEPGGCFVIENYIPELQRLPPGETVHPIALTLSTSVSRSTTWPPRSRGRTTGSRGTAGWKRSPPRTATCGRRSSI